MSPRVRRAVALVVLAVALSVTCTFLGRWQWHRHVARDAEIRIIEQNYDGAPVALEELLPTADAPLDTHDVWRQATVTGRYDASATVLLRNRPIDGNPGYHVLVPLVVTRGGQAGAVLLVDRGWVPTSDTGDADVVVPAPPSGDVAVTVHLRQDEPAVTRDAPAGQVQRITIAHVLEVGGLEVGADGSGDAGSGATAVYRAYGALVDEDPAPAAVPGALPRPSTDPRAHLSYAFQWWTFALGALVGFSVLARRELVEPSEEPVEPRTVRRRRSPSAEDEEDAILDAQGQASETRSR